MASSSASSSSSSSSTAPKPEKALIVGIDFGTTYSGVAWSFTGDPEKIRAIRNWPGNRHNLDKVPTVLHYSKPNSRGSASSPNCKWGFEVKPGTSNVLCWFKLLLSHQHANPSKINVQGSNLPQGPRELSDLQATIASLPKDKRPVDIVADYLRGLHQHLQNSLKNSYPNSFTDQLGKEVPIKYCLTVPAIWTDKSKALTVEAARLAGLLEGRNEIRLISEPEAAAVHCLRTFQETENCLHPGDLYVIADCGGGTVDLISYEIVAVSPRLVVKEAVSGSGSLCGSTSLNRRFDELVRRRLGEDVYQRMDAQARWTTLNHFEEYLKKTFKPPLQDEDEFEIESYYCPVPGVPNDLERGIQGNFLVLTSDEMVALFKPSFDEITRLVQEQVTEAEKRTNRTVTGVLLVGGYGSSDYLRQHLEVSIRSSTNQEVKILQPVDAWTAIVRGAVLDGLAVHESGISGNTTGPRSMVGDRIARYSYGIAACEPFIEGKHPLHKLFYSHRYGELMCRDRMSWFIEKGQEISDQKPIKVNLRATTDIDGDRDSFKFAQVIYTSDAKNPPEDKEHKSVQSLCTYEADTYDIPREYFARITSPVDGEDFWQIPVDMVMKYDSAALNFSTEVRGTGGRAAVEVGKAPKVDYDHDPTPSLAEQMESLGL